MSTELQAAKQGGSWDERPPIEKMRRHELWALARKHEIPFEHDATKNDMLRDLKGIDFSKPPAEQVYDNMGFLQLRKECTKRGIVWAKTDKRPVLMEKLTPTENV